MVIEELPKASYREHDFNPQFKISNRKDQLEFKKFDIYLKHMILHKMGIVGKVTKYIFLLPCFNRMVKR